MRRQPQTHNGHETKQMKHNKDKHKQKTVQTNVPQRTQTQKGTLAHMAENQPG